MHTVVVGQDHNGQQIVNADLTLIPPASLHPDVLSREVSVLDALADVDTTTVTPNTGDALVWDGTSWKPQAVNSNKWYREAFTVSAVPTTLTVVHGLAVDVVSVTVIRRGSPNVVVTPTIQATDVNTIQVILDGGPVGTYEVLVLSEGGGGVGSQSTDDYLSSEGGTMTGPLVLAADPVAALEAATKQYADGFQDTGFALNSTWVGASGYRPPGAVRQGLTVTIHGTMANPGLTLTDYSSHHVGTVSVGFRPTADFMFPIAWYDTETGHKSTYGFVRADGSIWVRAGVGWAMGPTDIVIFNATYTVT